MGALLWLLIAVPLGAGAALAAAGPAGRRYAPAVGLAAGTAVLGTAVAVAAGRPSVSAPLFAGMRAGLRVDGLSAVLVVTVAAVTLCVLTYSAAEFGRAADAGRFFGLMLLFAGSMLVTVTATTLPLLLMAWEVMGATSWALIGFRWRERHRVRAADTAFLTTRTADLGLYLAAGAAVAGGAGSLRLDALPGTDGPWLHLVTAGVIAAALGKSAQLPFSFWLSRAMEGPSPVSALLHSAAMVAAGGYLLLRAEPLLSATGWAGPLVAWAGAVTALALGVVAVAQRDLKQLLAASTSAQIGFIVLAAGCAGVAGGTAQFVAHAAVKAGLFLCAGAWLTVLGTQRLGELRGAARAQPWVGACFTVGALALAGLPPLSLWAAKDEVLAAARHQSGALYGVGIAAAAVAAVYSAKALWYVLAPEPAPEPAPAPAAAPAPAQAPAPEPMPERGREPMSEPQRGREPIPQPQPQPERESRPGPKPRQAPDQAGRAAGRRGPAEGAEVSPSAGRAARPRTAPAGLRWPLLPFALAAAALGVLALPGPAAWLRETVGAVGEPSPRPWEMALSAAVALAAAVLALWRPRAASIPASARQFAGQWLHLERAAHTVLVRPVLSLAGFLAAFDDRIVDGAVRHTARGGLAAARLARRLDDDVLDAAVGWTARGGVALGRVAGRLDDAGLDALVRSVAAGARRLGRWARRPQTGLLHQYYAQAAVGFAVLTLIVLLVR
ncbi:NADH-quinone oxidoreductase subunit 5 family protein [Streptomyces sp. bgisy032]|uniref:NADH-quinone oxidoreductase subunit 5 family protein n=1 Tax=Streptomyces sp. bgisy032 TaxID=3413773 RepID=UPI003D7099A6